MMYPKICVLLTGRGNNTLNDKNVIPVLEKPLLAYSAMEAKKIENVQGFFVSSENEKILAAAEDVGYTPIIRPHAFSLPSAQHVDCLRHAVDVMKSEHGLDPDILIVLLANSATVKKEWLVDCIDLAVKTPSATSVIPVQVNNDHHPYRAKKIDSNGFLNGYFDSHKGREISSNRQDLPPNYFVCHNFWVLNLRNMSLRLDDGKPPWLFMGQKMLPYIVDYSLDVHNQEDIYLTELWLKETLVGNSR